MLQPWEKYTTADGRETFALHSLGNFVSGQSHLPRRPTLMLELGLTRDSSGKAFVNGTRFVPLCMTKSSAGVYGVKAVDRATGLSESRALRADDRVSSAEPRARSQCSTEA